MKNQHLFSQSNSANANFYVIETSALEQYCEHYLNSSKSIDLFRVKGTGETFTDHNLDRVEVLLEKL
jgi:hypothetical protein